MISTRNIVQFSLQKRHAFNSVECSTILSSLDTNENINRHTPACMIHLYRYTEHSIDNQNYTDSLIFSEFVTCFVLADQPYR